MIKRRDFEELQAKAAKLEEELAGYKGKEKAIVEALTEAQNTAGKRVRDAEDQARSIVYEAERRREALIGENEALEREGKEKAAAIVSEAEAEAKAKIEAAEAEAAAIRQKAEEDAELSRRETEAAMREYTARLNALNGALLQAAETARKQALSYAAAVEAQVLPEAETAPDTAGLAAEEGGQAETPLPEEYESPAHLMKSLFRLQGREGPEDMEIAIEIDPEEFDEPPAIEIELLPEEGLELIACSPFSEPEAEPIPVAEPLPVVQPAPQPAVQPAVQPEAEAEAEEERLWTVEEVIAAAPARAVTEAPPVDLDSLLDDIMKEK